MYTYVCVGHAQECHGVTLKSVAIPVSCINSACACVYVYSIE